MPLGLKFGGSNFRRTKSIHENSKKMQETKAQSCKQDQ